MSLKDKYNEIKDRLLTWEETSTKREKVLLVLVTIILPFFLFYKFYYIPLKEKINNLKEDIKKIELEIAKLENFVKREKAIEEIVRNRKKFLEEIKIFLPTEKEIPQLIKNVSEIAKKNKLEILRFMPRQEERQNYYNVIPFDMELKGYFYDILKFLNEVEKLSRLVTLKNIEFSPQAKEEKIIIKTSFVTYVYTGIPLEEKQGKK
ncbi:MAG: type 4a pilus biogenesis protein PilO [Caldimicrobium sp.]|jgi:type IV pilus assembly protein PilO